MRRPEVPFYQREEGCAVLGVACWPIEVGDVRVGVQAARTWSVPGLFVLRVRRFGRGMPPETIDAAVEELARLARERPVLRLHLEAWTEAPEEMEAIVEACVAHGLGPSAPRSYTRTVWIELLPDPDETFMGLSKKARRDVRAPGKQGYEVRQIRSEAQAARLQAMMQQSFARTDATAPRVHWADWIRLSVQQPELLRIVGLFEEADSASENPLAFAAAVRHGDVAEYAHAGTAPGPRVKVPLLYAPTWDLMCWARDAGARWWDFGGVSAGPDEDDARAGINAFKFYFSKNLVDVGREWVLEPRPRLAKLGRLVGSLRHRRG